MATTATPPLLMAETSPSNASSEPEEEIEEEPEEIIPFTDHRSNNSPPHSDKVETLPPAMPLTPLFTHSVSELKALAAAISSFQQCYDDLRNHLDSIKSAILSKLPPETPDITPLAPSSSSKPNVSEERIIQQQNQPVQEQIAPKSEVEDLCKLMCSRGVRRYLATHLSNLPKLREEVPKALQLAPNPPKLVLECVGKFFLQGSKAFAKDSQMIPAREASILILECFLLMMGMDTASGKSNGVVDIQKAVMEEAEAAALAWRKRLLVEGGLSKANQIDARGILLLVACFGIPDSFTKEDIRDMVIAAKAKEIVGVLRNSHVLMNKIPEIVEGFMKNKMEVDAVDIVYTFGLEEKFNPQTILMQLLRESKESWKKPKKGQGSTATVNEVNKKQLYTLKSISKCLERHKIDPAKLLSGLQINEKIATLQKEISEFDSKSGDRTPHKRKSSETDSWKKPKTLEPKRPRYVDHGPQQQKAAGYVDSRRNVFDNSGLQNHANNYSPSVVYGGPSAGLMHEHTVPHGVGPGISSSHGGILSTASYPGQVVNHSAYQSYHQKYAGQPSSVGLTSLYRASTSVDGFAGVPNASSTGLGSQSGASDLYQFADSVAEKESYRNSVPHSVGAVPTVHYSSYSYQV